LHELKWMAEFAAELAQSLDGDDDGYFRIRLDEGNRLAFAVNDILRRVGEAIEALTGKAVQS
jgi:hypothetical protein